METKTKIEALISNEDEKKASIENRVYISKDVFDFSLNIEIRLALINNLSEDEVIEFVNKICSIYENTRLNNLRKNIIEIVERSKLKDVFKLLLIFSLYNNNPSDISILKLFYKMAESETINVFQKINVIKILMNNENTLKDSLDLCLKFLNKINLTSENKFKIILSFETDVKEWMFPTAECCTLFYKDVNNDIRHRILSCQLLLSKCQTILKPENKVDCLNMLLSIAKDEKESYNTKADATDILLKYSEGDILVEAKKIIKELGKINSKGGIGIYSNAQNVHIDEIVESIENSIEKLQSYSIRIVDSVLINVEYVRKQIFCFIDKNKLSFDKEKIEISLNRIEMDSGFYGRTKTTLKIILLKAWSYIETHEFSNEIKKRLCEELELSCDVCSSGFLSAIINSLSTYGFEMKISWRDQIISNFSGRLNKRIRDMDDLKLQSLILEELTIDTTKYENRVHLLKFLRENLLGVRDELHDEFITHITETDFDLYFRNAISEYETGSYI